MDNFSITLLKDSDIIMIEDKWYIVNDDYTLQINNSFDPVGSDCIWFKGRADAIIYRNILLDNV